MSDRRKAPRFAFTNPAAAHIRLVQDVIIERSDPEGLTVLSPTSSLAGEELALRLRGPGERMATIRVRTLASQPVVTGSSLQYRIDLRVLGDATPTATDVPTDVLVDAV
jgi:hypothetical protein